jgi:hypothetical protein
VDGVTDIYQMIKTQHCPNCEATEQKLHDFKQKVSDAAEKAVEVIDHWSGDCDGADFLQCFIIPKPKTDPLVDAIAIADCQVWHSAAEYAAKLRAALEARGLEIREKGQ